MTQVAKANHQWSESALWCSHRPPGPLCEVLLFSLRLMGFSLKDGQIIRFNFKYEIRGLIERGTECINKSNKQKREEAQNPPRIQ